MQVIPVLPVSTPVVADSARAKDFRVAVTTLVLLLLWEASGLDMAVARLFGTGSGFALQESWWTRDLIHNGGRLLGYFVLGAMALGAIRPMLGGPARAERLRWLAVTLVCLIVIPSIKHVSQTSCPWDLAEFGGKASYVPHWIVSIADGGPGHCFPSGHAVAAFAFFSLYFQWRSSRPVLARRLLAGVCAVGVVFGVGQLARGAHFPSHTFWSAWICWTLCVAADHLRRGRVGWPLPRSDAGRLAGAGDS